MRPNIVRALLFAGVFALGLSLAGIAGASSHRVVSKQVLLLQVYAGPMSPLDNASVTVTDADGVVVGMGSTDVGGGAVVRVTPAPWARPYRVQTSGGTTRGRAFEGHLVAVVDRIGRKRGPQWVSFATTVAAKYVALRGGSARSAERRVLERLGLSPKFGEMQLSVPTSRFSHAKLLQRARAFGGYDGVVNEVAARLAAGEPLPSFATQRVERIRARHSRVSTRQYSSTSVASAPCTAQTLPSPSANSPQVVGMYSVMIAAGTVSAFMTKDPSLLLNGVAGMVFSNTPGMTNASMLASLQAQLTCISQQIAQLQIALDNLTLLTVLSPLQNCVASITTNWNQYQYYIGMAASNPDDPTWTLTASNPNLAILFANIATMNSSTCNSIINQVLFNSQGGSQAAWPTIVSNYEKGDYLSSDSAGLAQSSVVNLQFFLQYYGTLEYQQSAMMTDYYNWLGLVNNKSYTGSQMAGWGSNCVTAPSLSNLASYQLATTWCQWQQNIVNAWPADLFTDEAGGWKQNTASSPYAIGGIAVSAVPANWGYSSNASSRSVTGLNPQVMNQNSMTWWKTWTAANALSSYNNQSSQALAAPYQNYKYRQMLKTATVSASQLSGYSSLGPYFSSWLNATYSSTNNTLTPCSSCQKWQLLGSNAYSSGGGTATNYNPNVEITIVNAPYSPSLWSGSTFIDPQYSSTPPAAFMVSRPWVQGGVWPAAPTISTAGAVAATATLGATGCPTSGCTWAITNGAPAGLVIGSTTGQLQWTGSAPGTTATIQVVAANTDVFSAPVTLTVQLT